MVKKVLSVIVFLLLSLYLQGEPLYAQNTALNSGRIASADNLNDDRVKILENFFRKYKSPLERYSSVFIEAAEAYDINWKLVPAITGTESTFGKFIPYNSYNAYGWNNGDYKFESWEDSIWHVTKTLKNKYYDRGLMSVEQIAKIYAPPSKTWARNTNFFINQLNKTVALSPDL